MKKILIYMAKNTLKPTGGPRGYLYNLNEGLKLIQTNDNLKIEYLPESGKESYHKYFDMMPSFIRKKYIDIVMRKRCSKLVFNPEQCVTSCDFNQYDAIHFHSTMVLASVKNNLKNYKGKIILTNHSPKPMFREWIEDTISESEYKKNKSMYDKLSFVEKEAYEIANYIIFPCPEAEEPCMNNWDDYKIIKQNNLSKYKYFYSGVKSPHPKLTREEVCLKYGIPTDSIIINYVGRHNTTKGYDNLKKIGEIILKKYENVYFLIAGKEEPLKGLNHPRWIEAGWINDPGTYYGASNIFILPNKETYFDLVMLEALSLGPVIVASKTGGNKVFNSFNTKGISLYNNIEEAIKQVEYYIQLGPEKLHELGKQNINIFNDNFNISVFANNYIKLLNDIIK